MFFMFLMSYMIGLSSIFFLQNEMIFYFIFLYTYSIVLFRTFPEKSQKSIAHAFFVGVTSAVLFDYVRGNEFIHYIWLLVTVPFFFLLGKGKKLFLEKNNYEWILLFVASAVPVFFIVMLRFWKLSEMNIAIVFVSQYFILLLAANIYIRTYVGKIVFILSQVGILYYLHTSWFPVESFEMFIFMGSLVIVETYHLLRGYRKLIPRLNNI